MTVLEPPRPITILEVTTPPDGTTRYIDQIVTMASPHVTFRYFTWKRAFATRYDVLHVHWPENLVRHASRTRRILQPVLLMALIGALWARKVPIVRTLHNVDPHEEGSFLERLSLKALDRATRVFVTINPVTRAPHGIEVSIPHGHYRARFSEHPRHEREPGKLVYAGLIRPYKGVERLIESFEGLPRDTAATLRVVGKPTSELRALIEAACARDGRISATLEFVPDAQLVAELTSAEIVCLPYDEMHNSGMALVGLSLNRPLIVPDTPTTRSLANEVGAGWMHLLAGRLDAESLEAAIFDLRTAASTRSARPMLEDRDWHLVSSRYEEAFRLAKQRRRH